MEPNTPVLYKHERYIVVMANPTYAVIEKAENPRVKLQVKVSDLKVIIKV